MYGCMVWVQFASKLGGVGDGLEVARSLGKLPVDVNKLLGFSCDASRREACRVPHGKVPVKCSNRGPLDLP